MISNAPDAESRSQHTEISIVSTVHTSATFPLDSKAVASMSEQEFKREMQYQIANQAAKSLLKNGAISEEEYRKIDTILLKKYRPTLATLLSGKPLI
jgi:hypothetical protein